ncbi:hypothetical protein LMG29542_06792 [Paraburkholderia humisilvae]|uniref:Uncharacterized protein n=1 Tax=Paraburkholderia humisilvae TaxID=627669 RepID=A0A6J5EZS1_9BURK|nr:hypothetical protein LMG29542_06792 [Paraburkholderia humisilvae]
MSAGRSDPGFGSCDVGVFERPPHAPAHATLAPESGISHALLISLVLGAHDAPWTAR